VKKKILLAVLAVVVAAAGVLGCVVWRANRSYAGFAKVDLGESTRFSLAERQDAADFVFAQFKQGYEGCTLKRVTYDEAKSIQLAATYADANGADPNDVIVLLVDFRTGALAGGGFNPNDFYRNWQYYLIRESADDTWRELSHGYC